MNTSKIVEQIQTKFTEKEIQFDYLNSYQHSNTYLGTYCVLQFKFRYSSADFKSFAGYYAQIAASALDEILANLIPEGHAFHRNIPSWEILEICVIEPPKRPKNFATIQERNRFILDILLLNIEYLDMESLYPLMNVLTSPLEDRICIQMSPSDSTVTASSDSYPPKEMTMTRLWEINTDPNNLENYPEELINPWLLMINEIRPLILE